MEFDFSISSIVAGFVFGVFGFYLIKEARKSGNFWHLFSGIALLAFPYFVSGALLTWGIGAGLLGVAWAKR